ncbi:hypothetical protein A0256_21910 [Mucilaginibacter sp. PAMC 26640]|nr:hypothetical protein A0256_21910 [Mucilaginibacter sp. PAMC 26640]
MAELNTSPEKQGSKVRSQKKALRVDLTAMVDLAFLLITFFMLTTTLSKPRVMDLTMPVGDEPGGEAASRTMTICLGENNQAMYYLGLADKPIIAATLTNYTRDGLRHAIMNTRTYVSQTTGKTMLVIIKPAESSIYENLVNTLDELNISNVSQYAIADIGAKDISLLKDKQAY